MVPTMRNEDSAGYPFTGQYLVEPSNCIFDRYVFAGDAGEGLSHDMGCDRNLWMRRARLTVTLSSSLNSSIPRMAITS